MGAACAVVVRAAMSLVLSRADRVSPVRLAPRPLWGASQGCVDCVVIFTDISVATATKTHCDHCCRSPTVKTSGDRLLKNLEKPRKGFKIEIEICQGKLTENNQERRRLVMIG